ncbi:hypothetical protein [Streptomyces sp. SID13588]|uniref:hypothetical protein n=1 Tax=Streptomyces sp. SID13588 TaxID=2706051 RepID=UPI0013C827ED|nr:hypothetical protein [Streptomyces sp. SID13588]NEA73805.1 hypothetical protein [Streptomyces sp. SID13588]
METAFESRWLEADKHGGEEEDRSAWIPAAYGADGRFRVKKVLAGAGQGYTLLAQDSWSGGDVVVKGMWWPAEVLANPRYVQDELAKQHQQRDSGLRAARQASQLTQQCPVVVSLESQPSPTLLAAGFADAPQEQFLVQQFIGNRDQAASTLKDEIERRAQLAEYFAVSELLDLAEQLCNTLAALHTPRHVLGSRATSWIHADVKPENVLVLGPPWRYVLIDYDAAVPMGARIRTTTAAYAPPSPPASRTPLGGRSSAEMAVASEGFDIYMLGATLADAAGLRRPTPEQYQDLYSENIDTHGRVKRQIAALGYGPILTSVIASCLAAPKMRLRSVDLVRIDLARARSATAVLDVLGTLGTPDTT